MKSPKIKKDANYLHKLTVRILLFIMVAEWMYLLIEGQILQQFLVSVIIIVLLAPELFRKRLDISIPAEFHAMAVLFTLASLYLGELQQFYARIWWWDIVLHTSAGLLMGIVGFLLVYILNESERIEINLKPGFIALFAFFFAVAIGTFWEIFEFSMDQVFGLTMQKPMLGDPSGLTDTMWDMIVNAAGAAIVTLTGWWYLARDEEYFIRTLIRKFIKKNPSLFGDSTSD